MQQRGTTAQRGYGGRWQRERKRFLRSHPLCAMCERDGRVELATVVDHIIPHKGNDTLMWDEGNWQALCTTHHNGEKQRIDKGGRPTRAFDTDGWPIE